MKSLQLDVLDEQLGMEIESWEEGQEYTLKIKLGPPGKATLLEGYPAEPEPEVESEEPPTPEAPMAEEGAEALPPRAPKGPMKSEENPAIALVIAEGNKKARK